MRILVDGNLRRGGNTEVQVEKAKKMISVGKVKVHRGSLDSREVIS